MANRSSFAVYQVENAVSVSAALGAYLNGRYEPLIELCADTIVWRSLADPAHAAFGGTFHGPAGVRRYFEALFGAYQISEPKVVDVIPAGDEVLHILQLSAAKRDGSGNGAAYVIGRWRFQNGRAVEYTDYFDVRAALQTSDYHRMGPNAAVTRDPSFDIYENHNAVRVSEILAAYKRNDVKPLFEALDPNVSWVSLADPHHAKFGGLFRGVDAVRVYFRRLSESLVLDAYEVVDIIPAGPEVLHVAEVKAHPVGDPSRTLYIRLVCIWTFQDGRVTRLREYLDTPSYLAQLSPGHRQGG